MRKLFCCLSLVVLLGLAAPALAGFISFDPFPSIPPDVTVEYFDGGLTGPLAALPIPNAVALRPAASAIPGGGMALFTYWRTDPLGPWGPYGVLFTFATPQTNVSMVGNDYGGIPTDNEVVHLSAFDSLGGFIGSSTFSSPFAEPNLKPVSFAGSDIKYIAFTWEVDLGYYAVDNVEYSVSVVPIPGAMFLLGSGLACLGAVGWRRKRG